MPARILTGLLLLFAIGACQKELAPLERPAVMPTPVQWTDYLIVKGAQYSDKNGLKKVALTEMKFAVQFDNSAIYQTIDPTNQGDINKLYGFSDNNEDHHINSARIGWRWYNNELQLFGYIYNNTTRLEKFITAVPLKQEITCSIKVSGTSYIFKVGTTQVSMTRTATTPQGTGYQLYPYFGGDEPAPHDISIKLKDI